MLQIDHIYEFLYQELFKDFEMWYIPNGVPKVGDINIHDISIFTRKQIPDRKIFLFDQEPVIDNLLESYLTFFLANPIPAVFVSSEKSLTVDVICGKNNLHSLYYFFHGFAALDWYRGYYALNYNKLVIKSYKYDFISFNRLIHNDRSYRIYLISLFKELGLDSNGMISFNVTENLFDDWQDETSNPHSKLSVKSKQHAEKYLIGVNKLAIDSENILGSASANIPRSINSWMPESKKNADIDCFWHIVTETIFYYDKLHLTEKIFKPIVSKQPFMLVAAPGNLAYLRSYGFKTFDTVIDESYDNILDNDLRIEKIVNQLHWYCNLTPDEKIDIIQELEPIIEHNFHHFYGEFRHIITMELLNNTKTLFQNLGYNDTLIDYSSIYHVLTN